MPSSETVSHLVNFNIDYYLDPFIPHNRLYVLPKPISRWLGYRAQEHPEPPTLLRWPITILATIAGLSLVGGLVSSSPGLEAWHAPALVGSLGATAVLDFSTIRSPLSQPRNTIVGNTLAAVCGVGMARIFLATVPAFPGHLSWLSAALGCALASWAMDLTGTVHPPGGATAVLASIDARVLAMGWRYVPLVLLSSALMVVVALIFNNILRQYPVYWWSAGVVGRKLREKRDAARRVEEAVPPERPMSDASSDRTLKREASHLSKQHDDRDSIQVSPHAIHLPNGVELSSDEMAVLKQIQSRMVAAY